MWVQPWFLRLMPCHTASRGPAIRLAKFRSDSAVGCAGYFPRLGTTTNWGVSGVTRKYFFHASRHSASGSAVASRTLEASTEAPWACQRATASWASASAPAASAWDTQNTTSSPRSSVPAAADGISEVISAAISSRSAAPTGTTTSTQSTVSWVSRTGQGSQRR